jgi:hypothetical protein
MEQLLTLSQTIEGRLLRVLYRLLRRSPKLVRRGTDVLKDRFVWLPSHPPTGLVIPCVKPLSTTCHERTPDHFFRRRFGLAPAWS